jgi:hypothetical protein
MLAGGAALALFLFASTACAQDVSVEVDITYFHERLAPHGHWIEVDGHGWCWYPEHIEVEWRPYSHGHWVYSDDYGWYWHSDYDWGWACFHYGRWTLHHERWIWVPGYEWSGAWVAWRYGGGYCGWAPLPPAARWTVGVGIATDGFSFEADIHTTSWVVVQEARFTSTRIHSVAIAVDEVDVAISKTKVLGSVSVRGDAVVNTALKVESIKPAVGEIKRVKLHETRTLGAAKVEGEAGQVRVFRPRVKRGEAQRPDVNPREAARKTLNEKHEAEREQFDRRRDGAEDDGARERMENDRRRMEERQKREKQEVEERVPDRRERGRAANEREERPDRGDRPDRDKPPKRDEPGRDNPPKGDEPGRDKPPKRDEPGRDKPPKGDDPSGRDKPPKRDEPGRDKPPKRDEPEDPPPPRKDDPDPPKRDKPPKRGRE